MNLTTRAARHAALGDDRRLRIVDHLALTDATFADLQGVMKLPGNLLAHHLHVLEVAGLIHRHVSEGDRRRRYISLDLDNLPGTVKVGEVSSFSHVAFVCTHNSARSQFAAALWQRETGSEAWSAGSEPSPAVHPTAERVAREFDLDISDRTPGGYDTLPDVDLIVSVCDRANEAGAPESSQRLHWSIPDPVEVGRVEAFRAAFGDIARRIDRLANQPTV